jgi:hypothetical protein
MSPGNSGAAVLLTVMIACHPAQKCGTKITAAQCAPYGKLNTNKYCGPGYVAFGANHRPGAIRLLAARRSTDRVESLRWFLRIKNKAAPLSPNARLLHTRPPALTPTVTDEPAVTARAVYLTAAPPSVHAAGRRALGAQSPLTGRLSPAALARHNCMLLPLRH